MIFKCQKCFESYKYISFYDYMFLFLILTFQLKMDSIVEAEIREIIKDKSSFYNYKGPILKEFENNTSDFCIFDYKCLEIKLKKNIEILPTLVGDCVKIIGFKCNNNSLSKLCINFKNLYCLKSIEFRHQMFKFFPPEIFPLTNLEHIDFSGNLILELPKNLEVFINLSYLIMTNNEIEVIEMNFKKLNKLNKLDLSGNIYIIPQILEPSPYLKHKAFFSLFNNSQIKHLSLREMNIKFIPDDFYIDGLETLFLSSNLISELPESFAKHKNMKDLILFNNHFTQMPKIIYELENLERLSLSSNFIYGEIYIYENTLTKLKLINIRNNKITNFNVCGNSHKSLEIIHMMDNNITKLNKNILFLPLLKDLQIYGNAIEKIDLNNSSYNEIKNIKMDIVDIRVVRNLLNLKNIKTLEINCRNSPDEKGFLDIFYIASEENLIEEINLSNCCLKESLEGMYVFKNLKKISYDRNNIRKVHNVFYGMEALEYLSFEKNRIEYIDGNIFNLSKLKYLNLRDNKLEFLHKGINCANKNLKINFIKNPLKKYGESNKLGFMNISFEISNNMIIRDINGIMTYNRINIENLYNKHNAEKYKWNLSLLTKPIHSQIHELGMNQEELFSYVETTVGKYCDNNTYEKIKKYLLWLYNKSDDQKDQFSEEGKSDIREYMEILFAYIKNNYKENSEYIQELFEILIKQNYLCVDEQFEYLYKTVYILDNACDITTLQKILELNIHMLKYNILHSIVSSGNNLNNHEYCTYYRNMLSNKLGLKKLTSKRLLLDNNKLSESEEYILFLFIKQFSVSSIQESLTKIINDDDTTKQLAIEYILSKHIKKLSFLKKFDSKISELYNDNGISSQGVLFLMKCFSFIKVKTFIN
ncbi:Leucine rich repeat protein [Spraguea lophii 42_110]|uniref:Leucine rich repeat protein n=1 Tax=Spraguea lophii (strain 42_110) TaxID=1358809 RepID=S7XGM5_SPRLO|nr:Leucine rich repeat protein [Spraguea lophii 42_110]